MANGFAGEAGDPARTGSRTATGRAADGWADKTHNPPPSADAMGWNAFTRPWRRDIGFGL